MIFENQALLVRFRDSENIDFDGMTLRVEWFLPGTTDSSSPDGTILDAEITKTSVEEEGVTYYEAQATIPENALSIPNRLEKVRIFLVDTATNTRWTPLETLIHKIAHY